MARESGLTARLVTGDVADGDSPATILRKTFASPGAALGESLAFIAATGDLADNGQPAELAALARLFPQVPVPVAPVVGNHDTKAHRLPTLKALSADGRRMAVMNPGRPDADDRYHAISGDGPADPRAGRGPYLDSLGPAYYAFWWGTLHFLVYDLDGQARHPRAYPQDDWPAAHLAGLPADAPIVLLQHFPFTVRQAAFWARTGRRPLATLSGHWHSSRAVAVAGTAHYSTPTLTMGGIDFSPHCRGRRTSAPPWSATG